MGYNIIMERLKELRMERKLSQKYVAEQLGISTRAYSHYEQGDRDVPIALLKELCKFFDVSADYLIGLTEY